MRASSSFFRPCVMRRVTGVEAQRCVVRVVLLLLENNETHDVLDHLLVFDVAQEVVEEVGVLEDVLPELGDGAIVTSVTWRLTTWERIFA